MTILERVRNTPAFQFTLSALRPFYREPESLAWAFAFPLVVTICMSLAFGGEAKNDAMIVGVTDVGHVDAAWVDALRHDARIKVVDVLEGAAPREVFLREHLDALLSPAGIVTTGAGGSADPFVTKLLAVRDVAHDGPVVDVAKTQVPGIRWIEWFIPGMIGLQMLSRGLNGTAVLLAEQRQRGYLKRLRLSPFRRLDYLFGFGAGRALIVVFEVALLLLVFRVLYRFQVQGQLPLFFAISLLGALACSLLGVAVTSRLVNSEAANGICSAIFFPSMFVSGVYFKVEKFPAWIQDVIQALPLGALNQALRLVANAGAPATELARPVLVLVAWVIVSLAAALKFFRWDPKEAA